MLQDMGADFTFPSNFNKKNKLFSQRHTTPCKPTLYKKRPPTFQQAASINYLMKISSYTVLAQSFSRRFAVTFVVIRSP